MTDSFKQKLDELIKKFLTKINDAQIIPEIQKDYDFLIEEFNKFIILSKEEFNSIENDINNYEENQKKLTKIIN